jgi:hypothetical protein
MVLRTASNPEGPQVPLSYYVRRPAADLRQRLRPHARREYGANGGQILYLYLTYSRSTGTRCAWSLSNSIARDIRA